MERKELVLLGILGAILAIWLAVGLLNSGYAYWPAVAGALTIPFLLMALFVDNLPFLPKESAPNHQKKN